MLKIKKSKKNLFIRRDGPWSESDPEDSEYEYSEPEPADGWLTMSDAPGLGFELNRDRLQNHLI